MTQFACEKEWTATLKYAYLQISRLGAFAPTAILLVRLLLLEQSMESRMVMPLPPILTAN